MIKFESIRKSFQEDFWKPKNLVLNNLSFSVREGRVVGFLGANGAGKTTSIRILMGFSRPDSGEVKFEERLGRGKDIFKKIAFLPERPYFYPDLKGTDFINYMGKLQGLDTKTIKSKSIVLGEQFNISHAFDKTIRGYSKGMLQRIGFVCSLLHDPEVVILDEPLSGLDPIGRKELKDAIWELKKLGKTIFFSSHIVSDVEEVCDDVVFIEKGELVYEGTVSDLLARNSNSQALISIINSENAIENISVALKDLNNKLNELISKDIKILKVNSEQKTLEEVLYENKGRTR